MQKTGSLIIFLIPVFAIAQSDFVVVTKGGKHVQTYASGSKVYISTIYDQQFQGTITEIWHDSIFIDGMPFHYREIASFKRAKLFSGFLMMGTGLMIAGGGFIVLSAINGALRGDQFKLWHTTAGLITVGAFEVAGYIIRKAFYVTYNIGKKYQLQYFALGKNKK
jgi:hypothetical protein